MEAIPVKAFRIGDRIVFCQENPIKTVVIIDDHDPRNFSIMTDTAVFEKILQLQADKDFYEVVVGSGVFSLTEEESSET